MDLDDQFAELNSAFTTWLTESGKVCLNPKIGLQDLRSSSSGRGVGAYIQSFSPPGGRAHLVGFFCLVALTPLEEDETVFTVPRTSVLCVENSELFEKLREELTTLAPWLVFLRAHI